MYIHFGLYITALVVCALVILFKGVSRTGTKIGVARGRVVSATPVFSFAKAIFMLFVMLAVVGIWIADYLNSRKLKVEEQRVIAVKEKDRLEAELTKAQQDARGVKETDTIIIFWPGKTERSQDGYLMSDKFIPLRAIARYPNAPTFKSDGMEFPKDVVGIMKPWYPYYVFDRKGEGDDEALLVGTSGRTQPAERRWVRENDCFCWTTRECLNIERPVKIYETREDAEDDINPINESYTYAYNDNFKSGIGGTKEQEFQMAALPVLHREDGEYWCFVRPEGTEHGYQLCWTKWDGSDSGVRCRIRSARREFEEYLTGVRGLMIEWRNPERKTSAKRRLYDHGSADMVRAEKLGEGALDQIKARREGIRNPQGFLEQPIEHPLQYEKVSKRAVKLIEISSSPDAWDINDVAYIPVEELP